jgi:transposase
MNYNQTHYNFFIGIDVSKQHLDLALLDLALLDLALLVGGRMITSMRIQKEPKAIRAALQELVTTHGLVLKQCVFCLEHTGIYSAHLLGLLDEQGLAIWLEHPLQIKYSLGMQRGKNDRIDAQRIAQYAYKNRDSVRLWKPTRKLITQLQHLSRLRDRLLSANNSLKVALAEGKPFSEKDTHQLLTKHCRLSLQALQKDLQAVEKQIQHLIDSHEHLSQLFSQLTSMPGMGRVTASELIISTNEFKDFDSAKKLACYAGVAPFEHSSGKSLRGRTRVNHQANKRLKTLLQLVAMRTVRLKNKFARYYQRKVEEGKNKMLVLNAVRNKLLHTLFALVKHNQKYDENYAL